MSANRTNYIEAREALLADIAAALKNDERFVAAWLAGSYGLGKQDMFSDLDLHVVVADAYSERLCATPWMSGAKTTGERLALFSQFGTPAIIFEAHSNNQVGGTFTYVLYQESAINVDWMLIPQALAHQEHPSLLLFDKVGIPEPPHPEPESLQERIEKASTHVGFFWMIAASNVLNLLRHDLVKYHMLLDWLHSSIREVQAALKGEQAPYRGSSYVTFYAAQEGQIAALRQLCDEMEALMPQVVQLGGYVPSSPRSVVEMRLALMANNEM